MSRETRLLSTSAYFRDFGNQLVDDFGTIPTPTEDERQRARLTVCAEAESVEEARTFLSMLGLVS